MRFGELEPEQTTGDYIDRIDNSANPWQVYLDTRRNTRYWQNPFLVGQSDIRRVEFVDGTRARPWPRSRLTPSPPAMPAGAR
jgi:hypothetical protein